MTDLTVVRRYAQALFDTAAKAGSVDQVEEDLRALTQTFAITPRLGQVLRAPVIPGERKQQLVQNVFAGRLSPLTLRFLNLVISRRREEILADVYPEFQRLANEARGLMTVEVTSAVPLTDEQRARLGESLAVKTGKRVQLMGRVDPEIMGGLVLRIGDTIVDGSVRTRLQQLRSRLLTGAAV